MPTRTVKHGSTILLAACVAAITALAALLARIGADANWLAALGHLIVQRHSVPAGVPFAAAASNHWANPLVLAELVFYALERAVGERGLLLAQLVAVAGAMTVVVRDARAGGATVSGTCAALLVAAVGSLSSLAIVRVQLFSLLLFPALIALLHSQARHPSWRIWLLVPLLALWSNLHGAALLGLGVTFVYLACSRGRRQPLLAVGVAGASSLALCLTPALWRTPDYYRGLLTNVAAERGQGMWGPLSLTAPLDIVLLLAAAVLLTWIWRARPMLWEWAVIAALSVLTVEGSRNGVWLLLFLAPLAARACTPKRSWAGLAAPALAASVAALAFALARGPVPEGASPALLARALALAHGTPVLADDQIAEQVALVGGQIWAGDPIDAFSRPVQATYLDWIEGIAAGRQALASDVRVVLVSRGTGAQTLMGATPRFRLVAEGRTADLYERDG